MEKPTSLRYKIAMTFLDGIGPKTVRALMTHYESPDQFFEDKFYYKLKISGFSTARLKKINKTEALKKADVELDYIKKEKIETHYFLDENYPFRLKNCIDAPIILYSKGNFNPNPTKVIAIVGTRNITGYGKKIVEDFVSSLHPYDIQIISGLAYGVDVLAHRMAIKHKTTTIGVLGHGLDRIYPALHKNIAQDMIKNGGGVLTEFTKDTTPDRENFPRRNRIVAGMCDATVVIESGKKGGSLITANLANDYSRDVFAFPGNINYPFSEGCNHLIAQNKAHLITSGNDFIKLMGWERKTPTHIQPQLFTDLNPEENKVVQLLQLEKKLSVDVMSIQLKKPVSALNGLLLGLELQGVIKSFPGNKFGLY